MKRSELRVGITGVSFAPFYAFKEAQFRRETGAAIRFLEKLGCVCVPTARTFTDVDGATRTANFLKKAAVDFVILDVCTFPEGKAMLSFASQVDVPLALWCRPEPRKHGPIGHNCFCGANYAGGNLSREGRHFRTFFGDIKSRDFSGRLTMAVHLLQAAKSLRGARIGLVGGGIVPKFFDIDVREEDQRRLKRVWDIEFVTVSFDELMEKMRGMDANAVAGEAGREATAYRRLRVGGAALTEQARMVLALEALYEKRGLSALAIRCWPEMQSTWRLWPCGAIGHLNQRGIPVACEGDPVGALDMLLASRLSDQPSTLMDIIDFDDRNSTFSIWHCGPTAPSWAHAGAVDLIPHNVDGKDSNGKPKPGLPCVHEMTFKTGAVTVLRTLGALDDEFCVCGAVLPPRNGCVSGCFGRVGRLSQYGVPVTSAAVRNQILSRGIPHHYAVYRDKTSREE